MSGIRKPLQQKPRNEASVSSLLCYGGWGGSHTGETKGCLTCEGVNNETDNHRDRTDEGPVRKPLVLHAAVDGDGSLMALQEEKLLLCYVEQSVEKVMGRITRMNIHIWFRFLNLSAKELNWMAKLPSMSN